MSREEVIRLLTLARVYDARVTVGKAEAAAWFLAVNRVPHIIAERAVTEHYTAPIEPGGEYPRIAPGHVMAYYQAHNRAYDKPVPAIAAPTASPEFVAQRRSEIANAINRAAAKFALDGTDPLVVPRWRPGTDKRELALAQVEASRRRRAVGGTL